MELKDQVQGVVIGLFGAYAGGYFADLTSQAETGNPVALVEGLVNLQTPLLGVNLSDDAAWVDTILGHLGVSSTSAAYTAAAAWANGELDAGASRAEVVLAAVTYLLGDSVEAQYASVATAFKADVAAGVEYSEGAGAEVLAIGDLREAAGNPATGTSFNLTAALAELKAADAALKGFLTSLDLDKNGKADHPTDADAADAALTAALTAAWEAANDKIGGDYISTNTAAVNAALLANQQATNTAILTIAQNNLTAANAAVAAVKGLQAAIDAYEAAVAAAKVTHTNLDKAEIAFEAAAATYDVTAAAGKKYSEALFVIDEAKYTAKLANGVTETTHPGITTVLQSLQALLNAGKADDAADALVATRTAAVLALDPAFGDAAVVAAEAELADAEAELGALLAAATIAAQAEADEAAEGVAGEIDFNFDEETGAIVSYSYTDTVAGDPPAVTPVTVLAANTDVDNAYNAFLAGEYADAVASLAAAQAATSLYEEQLAAKEDVKDAEEAIADLAKVVATLTELRALDAERDALEKAVADVIAKIEDDGNFDLVDLSVEGNSAATLGDDLFLATLLEGNTAVEITGFGAAGTDVLAFGGSYALVQLGETQTIAQNVGNANALEIFWEEDAGGLTLYVETAAFGGNSAGLSEIVTITLTGFSAADITNFNGSFLVG